MARSHGHICGFYYLVPETLDINFPSSYPLARTYLPQIGLSVHSTIVSTTSRTTLSQNFVNPLPDRDIPELRYTFPLYDGVSVVAFTCTINKDRVIRGVVKERDEARRTYDQAIQRGETAGLLEQLPEASDVFTTTVGNVPAGAEIKVDITYLGELKHDSEVDGIRLTIPTTIAPRYGDYPGQLANGTNVSTKKGIEIVVDAEMPSGSNITSVKSPSHPISVTIGNTSIGAASGADMSLQKASATLSLSTTELEKDFVLQVIATNNANPIALLETHPTLPNHRAIMATLVPKFNLPSSRPEIVFVCDRSGSMGSEMRIPNLKAALQIFLKSLPLGVKFNICSFGSRHELLFPKGSVSYDPSALEKATIYVNRFAADFGGTEMYRPLEEVITKRYKDMDLEIFLLTDGETWNQESLFELLNKNVRDSKGAIRLFTLGIGNAVSHALIEGLARSGNGFAQTVMDNEKMNSKVVRMLKAALTPHITDYTLEVKYAPQAKVDMDGEDEFEMIEKVEDALSIRLLDPSPADKGKDTAGAPAKAISLFDPTANPDVEMTDASKDTAAFGKYAGVPPVSEPKILQAPFTIPPLYPFNRTSVYLLLSPETTQTSPKSVVLRGTSVHGPLELEIPVVILQDKAETIHQLAARKAIRELEDGRGWITFAKDSESGAVDGGGKLLKDKFEGRFSDMVEREAVRLGVKFQVGGKWCSFVAVEGNNELSSKAASQGQPPSYEEMNDSSFAAVGVPLQVRSSLMRRSMRSQSKKKASPRQTLASAPTTGSAISAQSMSSPWLANGMYGRGGMAAKMALPGAQPPPPAPTPRAAMAQLTSCSASLSFTPKNRSRATGPGYLTMGAGYEADEALPEGMVPNDDLEDLVKLQTFEGYWTWTPDLFKILKIDGKAVTSRPETDKGGALSTLAPQLGKQSNTLATAIVLVFLETRMAGKKDEWEMLAGKAYGWLEADISNGTAKDFVDIVRGLLDNMYQWG